jgi:hypothetical protein
LKIWSDDNPKAALVDIAALLPEQASWFQDLLRRIGKTVHLEICLGGSKRAS